VRVVEKSVSPNFIKIILKFGVIWITCSKSLKLEWCFCLIGEIDRGSSSKVRKASFKSFNSNLGKSFDCDEFWFQVSISITDVSYDEITH